MRKSNIIALSVLALISLFLLFLWWYLGFAKVDAPTDVLISVVWWAAIAAMAFGIYRMEQRRRQQMRTVYVSPTSLFNCESGLVECRSASQRADLIEEIVKSMRYGMDFQDMPAANEFPCTYIVRTEDYKDADDWRGTVVKVDRSGTSKEKAFSSRTSLISALSS